MGLFVRFVHFVSDARLHKGCARERAIVIEHTHSFFFIGNVYAESAKTCLQKRIILLTPRKKTMLR